MKERNNFFMVNSEEEFEKELRKPVIDLIPELAPKTIFNTEKFYFNKPLEIKYSYPSIFTKYNYEDEQYVYERDYMIVKRFYKLLSFLKNYEDKNEDKNIKGIYNESVKYFDQIAKVEELNYDFNEIFLTYTERFLEMIDYIAKKYVKIRQNTQKVKRKLSFWEKLNPAYWLKGNVPTELIEGYVIEGVDEEWINNEKIKRDVKDLYQLFKEMKSISPKIVEEFNNLKIENKKLSMNLNERLRKNKYLKIIQDSIYLGDQNIRILKRPESLLKNSDGTEKFFKNMIKKIK